MDYMDRSLELASRALGWCSPNPAVGAVLVRDGVVVGEGFTQPAGSAHAEVVALRAAGAAAKDATLFVTLEPCSHHGRTPPCADALVAAGVGAVHIALLDPSPWVNGAGARRLEAAGVQVHVGTKAAAARTLNEAYFKWVRTKIPFVTLKYAMTADGKSATHAGSSFWVSGRESRAHVAELRSQVDAVLVGVGTIEADDPQLTARPQEFGASHEGPVHQPLRVVLDTSARIPISSKVISGGLPGRTVVCTTERAPLDRVEELTRRGVEVLLLPEQEGLVDVAAALKALGEREVTSVLVEAGGVLGWSLLAAGVVDKVLAFVAPKIVGGARAPTPIEGPGLDRMDQAVVLRDAVWTVFGADALLTGYVDGATCADDALGAGELSWRR